jgi:hypothetical protein
MKIGVLSDLYIDKLGSPPAPEVMPDVLVLAGNIGCGTQGIEWAEKTYPCPIVYVLGNYSYRGHDIETADDELRARAWGTNFHILQDETLIIRGVRFIGTTLWTDFGLFGDVADGMRLAQEYCTDYKFIHKSGGTTVTPADIVKLHRRAAAYLWRTATEPYDDGHTVVVTHHAPSLRSVPTGFRDDLIAACFASDLDELVAQADAMLWVHAGVYGPVDYELGGTHVIANPRAMMIGDEVHELHTFKPDYTVEMFGDDDGAITDERRPPDLPSGRRPPSSG